MTHRDCHPMRRSAREEARVWPVAILLVALYLVVAHWTGADRVQTTVAPLATEEEQ